MNTPIFSQMVRSALCVMLAGIIFADLPAAFGADANSVYYATTATLKMATEDQLGDGYKNIAVFTKTHKALINLAQGLDQRLPVPRNIVLALRLDNCVVPAAQMVVYDKNAGSEVPTAAPVTEPFSFPIDPLLKERNSDVRAARFVAEAAIHPGGFTDFALDGGGLMLSLAATRSATAIDDCPNTISGALLGYMTVTLTLTENGQDTIQHPNVLILSGSTLSAKRLPPPAP